MLSEINILGECPYYIGGDNRHHDCDLEMPRKVSEVKRQGHDFNDSYCYDSHQGSEKTMVHYHIVHT